jgi:RimJ/RimL family protein N-acetyltransferase
MTMKFLEGERLYLRPLVVDDLDRCLRWINDPEILRFLGRKHPMSREMEQEWLAKQYKDERHTNFAIILKDGDRHIGNCGLDSADLWNRNASFGILIGEKDCWHQGYGPEAARLVLEFGFAELGFHRIYLTVFSFNERAQRAYAKTGFVHEGTRREDYYRHGEFHDTHIMSILESEWREGKDG